MDKKERKKRQHKKELKSLENKMSTENLIWFRSLSLEKKYDFLFAWKHEKNKNKLKNVKKIRKWGVDIKLYPPSLKHFIKKLKKSRKFRTNTMKKRKVTIDLILN